jgi:hypothetical protein
MARPPRPQRPRRQATDRPLRIPRDAWRRIDELLDAGKQHFPNGFTNEQLTHHVLNDAHRVLRTVVYAMARQIVSARISARFGGVQDAEVDYIRTPDLPNMELPAYASVPQDDGRPVFKPFLSLTTTELARVISHRESLLAGHVHYITDMKLVLAIARERGCGNDEPISTVIGDLDNPDPSEDRPTPEPPQDKGP